MTRAEWLEWMKDAEWTRLVGERVQARVFDREGAIVIDADEVMHIILSVLADQMFGPEETV